MPHRPLARGAILLSLLTSLQACTSPPVETRPEIIGLTPPAEFLQPVDLAEFAGSTNGELLDHDQECMTALAGANLNLAKIRAWAAAPK